MFAKPYPTAEKKLLQIIVFAGRQRIGEPLRSEELKCAAYHAAGVTIVYRPGVCKVAHRWTNRCRHLERVRTLLRCDLAPASFLRRGLVLAGFSDVLKAGEVIAPREHCTT